MNITRTSHTLTSIEYVDRGHVVVCDSLYMGRDVGSKWELDRVVTEREMEASPHGGFQQVGSDGPRYFGFKLTKKGTRLTGHAHLLPWIHSAEDVERCTLSLNGAVAR